MTITTNPARNEYTANAGQTVFNYTFKIFENTDLNVYVTPVGQECTDADLTTAYIVDSGTIGDPAGGFITLNTPTGQDDLVTIALNVPSSRTIDYQNNGDFRPDTVNDDFDRVVSIAKKVEDRVGRTLQFKECEQNSKDLTLPKPESGKILVWNAQETGMENLDIPTIPVLTEPEEVNLYTDFLFNSIQDMKDGITVGGEVVNLTVGSVAKTLGYYSKGDQGGATYSIVTGGTGVDDGGSIIDLNNGNQAALLVSKIINVRNFGCSPAVFDNAININKAIVFATTLNTFGSSIYIPSGNYVTRTTINLDTRVSLFGSSQNTTFIQTFVTGTTAALFIDGSVSGENIHGSVQNIAFIAQNLDGYGIAVKNAAYMTYQNINTENYAGHWDLRDCLSSTFIACRSRFSPAGAFGLFARNDGVSNPNALTFVGCTFGSINGVAINLQKPSNFSYTGGSVEACGQAGQPCVRIENAGGQGAGAFSFDCVYFEKNIGTADIAVIQNGGEVPFSGTIEGCSFNRINATAFTEHNILLQQVLATDPYVSLSIQGNGFLSGADYVVDPSRQYIQTQSVSDNGFYINESANSFQSFVEWPNNIKYQVPYSTTMFINADNYSEISDVVEIVANNANNVTMAAPTRPSIGQKLTFVIRNVFGGLGTLTWDNGASGYRLSSPWVQPVLNTSRIITFTYMSWGTWMETSRNSADTQSL